MSIPYASIPVGGILMLVFLIETVVNRMRNSKKKSDKKVEISGGEM